MVLQKILDRLRLKMAETDHPRELVVEVMLALQKHYGYLSDEALQQGADLLDLTPLELEELATFYEFIYRQPVGKYVIHVCDSTVCWMLGHQSILDHLSAKLGIPLGGTTADGLFTLLPVCCVGYCNQAPAMLINGTLYGPLSPESIDSVLEILRDPQATQKKDQS